MCYCTLFAVCPGVDGTNFKETCETFIALILFVSGTYFAELVVLFLDTALTLTQLFLPDTNNEICGIDTRKGVRDLIMIQ